MASKFKISVVLGIRPDVIRTSQIIKKLKSHPMVDLQLIWTGQHYDEKLMKVFFKELDVPLPNVYLDCAGGTHAEQHSRLIGQLEKPLQDIKTDVCVFLGDANAAMGFITPLKLGIPIAHIEAGSRSFDLNMPEEMNRVLIDRVADVMYAYHQNYKYNLIREGINPDKVVVCGNTIVDVLNAYNPIVDERAEGILAKYNLKPRQYGVMTIHRDLHMVNTKIGEGIVSAVAEFARQRKIKILWPRMPRAKVLNVSDRDMDSFIVTDPLGLFEFLALEKNALIEFTDSGTNQETAPLQGVPSVVTRKSTERPETFDSGISVMAYTRNGIIEMANKVIEALPNKNPGFSLGNGHSASIIVNDLLTRCELGLWKIQDREDTFVRSHFSWK